MTTNKLIHKESSEVATQQVTEVTERIDTLIANRTHIIERVKPLLIEQVDVYTLPGMKKPSLGKPGAEKLAAVFGLRASFKVDTETAQMMGDVGKTYVAYVCTLTHNGEFAGEGRGATFVELSRTNYKNMNAREFAVVQATLDPSDYQVKQGQYGQYYRVKEGTVFDPLALNKAIKMAQKSAFVDAVIRTTGMSDLFTQDVEDVGGFVAPHEMAQTEPVYETPNMPPDMPQDNLPAQAQGSGAQKQCPICQNWHQGQYPKCYSCWQKNRQYQPTKKVINYDEPPFA